MSTYTIINGTGIQLIPSAEIPTTTYEVSVTQLAQAQTLTSVAISDATLGTGNLTIAIGAESAIIPVTSMDTLDSLVANINASALSKVLISHTLPGTDGNHLVLASLNTGSANTIQVTADSTLNANLVTASFAVTFPAQDAELAVNGIAMTSPTNMIKDVIANYLLVLNPLSIGVTQSIQV